MIKRARKVLNMGKFSGIFRSKDSKKSNVSDVSKETEEFRFKPISIKSPDEAISILFGKALETVPEIPNATVLKNYKDLTGVWASKGFGPAQTIEIIQGNLERTQAVVLRNLKTYASLPDFREFQVFVKTKEDFARISVINSDIFFDVVVMRTKEYLYCCGNFHFTMENPVQKELNRIVGEARGRLGY